MIDSIVLACQRNWSRFRRRRLFASEAFSPGSKGRVQEETKGRSPTKTTCDWSFPVLLCYEIPIWPRGHEDQARSVFHRFALFQRLHADAKSSVSSTYPQLPELHFHARAAEKQKDNAGDC